MKGVIIRWGRYWGPASTAWARQRLLHRGEACPLVEQADLEIIALGGNPGVQVTGRISVWSSGIDEIDRPAVLKLAAEGRVGRVAPSRWRRAFHVVLDRERGRLSIVRGEFCRQFVQYASKRHGFFCAPEIKAFSNLRHLSSIRALPPGYALEVDLMTGNASLHDGRVLWPAPSASGDSFEESQSKLREIAGRAVRQVLDAAPRPIALALSGGLDSAVVAWLAVEAGYRLKALTVTFAPEADGGEPAPDLLLARRVSELLGLEMEEIRVRESELDSLIPDAIYRSEAGKADLIEGSLHWLVLGHHLPAAGFRSCLTGGGIDSLFGGVLELQPRAPGADFHRTFVQSFRKHVNLESESLLMDSHELRVLEPFDTAEMQSFGLGLPEAFLIRREGRRRLGKRIVREAFANDLPPEIVRQPKKLPVDGNNLGRIVARRYGEKSKRTEVYDALRGHLLRPKQFGLADQIRRLFLTSAPGGRGVGADWERRSARTADAILSRARIR